VPGLKNWSKRLFMPTFKDHFLSFAKKNLDELERSWIQHGPKHIADAMLPLIEEQLARVEVAVEKYGPTIRIIAG